MTIEATVLVLDIGLTRVKAVVFTTAGIILDRAAVAYPTRHPRPEFAEQDPEEWWRAAIAATHQVWQRQLMQPNAISAVTVTGHMHAAVALDGDGQALGPALVLGDTRAQSEAATITKLITAEEIHRITGTRMDASMPAAKMRWMTLNDPGRTLHTRAFLGTKDFIRHRLTGDLLTDPIDATATSLFDIRTGTWSPELLSAALVSASQMPEPRRPDSIAGHLTHTAAQALSLRPGTPVIVGSGDDIEILGCGLAEPGQAVEHLGTTGSILTVVDEPPPLAARSHLELYPHALPDRWVIGGSITAAGSAIDWARQVLGFSTMAGAIQTLNGSEPTLGRNAVFLPALAGERAPVWRPEARGAWLDLTLTTTRQNLMVAAFEGVAHALRSLLDSVEALAGNQAAIHLSGTNSRSWIQLRADTYNHQVVPASSKEPTALGAMILASTAVGLFPDLLSAMSATVRFGRHVQPDAEAARTQEARHLRYEFWAQAMRPLWTQNDPGQPEPGPTANMGRTGVLVNDRLPTS